MLKSTAVSLSLAKHDDLDEINGNVHVSIQLTFEEWKGMSLSQILEKKTP